MAYLLGVLHVVWLFVSLLLLFVATTYIGYIFLNRFNSSKLNVSNIVYYLVGQVVLSLAALLIALVFGTPFNTIIIFVLVLICFYKGIKLKFFNFSDLIKFLSRSYKKSSFFVVLVLVVVIFWTIKSLSMPYTWDDIAYHFPVVQEISRGNLIFPLLSNSPYLDFYTPFSVFYGSLPYASESFGSIIYTLSFNYPGSVQVLNYFNFLLLTFLILKIIKKDFRISYDAIFIAFFAIFTIFDVDVIVATGYVDLNVVLFQLLSLIYVSKSLKENKDENIFLSALFFGYSIGMKYSALFLLPIYLFLLFLILIKNRFKNWKTASIALFFLFFFEGFWYLKNLVLYSNPIYPLYLGHNGISDEVYKIIVDSQINLVADRSVKGFILFFEKAYLFQPVFYLFVGSFVYYILSKKLLKENLFIVLCISSIYLLIYSFFYGSGITRFTLLVPISFALISIPLINKFRIIGYVFVILSIFYIGANPLYKSIWQTTYNENINILTGNTKELEKNKLGCAYNIVEYYRTQKLEGKIINFWDPYASLYFSNQSLFYNFYGYFDYLNFKIPSEVRYLYLDTNKREGFLQNPDFHKDILPVDRFNLERTILGNRKPIFTYWDCGLYEVKTQ